MILIHSGIHFNALLPWLAVLMLLIAVASGLVGKFLLKRANDTLKDKITELINSGMQRSDAEKKLFMDSIAVDMMKKWRVVHLPITIILGVLSLLHILSIIIFSINHKINLLYRLFNVNVCVRYVHGLKKFLRKINKCRIKIYYQNIRH